LDNVFQTQIKQKDDEILQLRSDCLKSGDIIFDKSVRTDIADKKLLIIKTNKGLYKLSSNSTTKSKNKLGGEILETYTFPATLNIKQDVRKVLGKNGNMTTFKEEELPDLRLRINDLLPK
jgi:hypothetical protein